ncbi:hypothetical protein YPPY52_3068, partial [Yersinia pestis PY-52]
MFVTFSLRCR